MSIAAATMEADAVFEIAESTPTFMRDAVRWSPRQTAYGNLLRFVPANSRHVETVVETDSNDWLCDNSSSEVLWDLMSDHGKVATAITQYRSGSYFIHEKRRVLERLDALNDMLRDDPEEPNLNHASVGRCLRFLSQNADLRRPDIAATPAGTILCQWRRDRGRNLTIEFCVDGQVNYVVFAPEHTGTARVSGRCHVSQLRTAVSPFHITRWAARDAR